MSRNPGTGVYTLPAGTYGAPNTPIASGKYNAAMGDLEQDANTARPISVGGTGATNATAAREALGANDAGNLNQGTVPDARLPSSMSSKTFNTKVTANSSGAEAVGNRGYRWWVDGVEYGSMYFDNTNMVLNTPNSLKIFSAQGLEVSGGKVKSHVGGASAAADRGYRWWIDGNEQAAMYYDNNNMVLNTGGTLVLNGYPVVKADGAGYSISISGNAATATTAGNANSLGGIAASGYVKNDGGSYGISITGAAAYAAGAGVSSDSNALGGVGPSGYVKNDGATYAINISGNAANLGGVAAASYLQTANLRSEYAGIGVDEVGSVAMLSRIGAGTFNAGDTSIGSSLRYANVDNTSVSATAPNGTWRCHGRATGGGGTASITLWKRIA